MNISSQSRVSPRLIKIQHPQPQPLTSITPKKQSPKVKLESTDDPSTLQKTFSFPNQLNLQTIHKDKKKPKRPWNPQEDQLLKELVNSKGPKEWAFISSYFHQRCGKQCRERWHNHLRTGIRKGDWSYEEEWLLFLGVHAYGKRWSIISKILEGRTENTLKNHWNCKMKPKKQLYSKRLARTLTTNSSYNHLSKKEIHLIGLIHDQSFKDEENLQDESQNTRKIIKLLKGVIQNFLESRKMIYRIFQPETRCEDVKIEEERSVELSMIENCPQKQQTSREDEKVKELKLQNLGIENQIFYQNQTFGLINDFGSDSSQFHMKMSGLIKEVSEMEVRNQDEVEVQEYEVDEWSESEETKKKMEESGFGFMGKFASPLRRNIFDGMNLDESNKKKRLFESEEKEGKRESE